MAILYEEIAEIDNLGECNYTNPQRKLIFVKDNERVLYNTYHETISNAIKSGNKILSFEKAGPRQAIYFNPVRIKAAIVTCGGLCPGLNNVIRALVMELYYNYGVKEILGIKYGYKGFSHDTTNKPVILTPEVVQDIHNEGGTFLGSSRGEQDISKIVDYLYKSDINMLFTIGGDGTLRGAQSIYNEIKMRGLKISVIGIPKTIDNDIDYINKSFGFDTSVEEAAHVIKCAHTEAENAPNGISLVKLMGRHAGFIAAYASMAQKDVNYCLIPEVDFDLQGSMGLFNVLKERLRRRGHALIVVAEGAGIKYLKENEAERDASGNVKYGDIGIFLKDKINEYFKSINVSINLKYLDPSYSIRSIPANSSDKIYCGFLAFHAAHAALAGKTGMMVGSWNNIMTHVPLKLAVEKPRKLKPDGTTWSAVLASTGQPPLKNQLKY